MEMEKNELKIERNERARQSRSSKITNSVFGILLLIYELYFHQFSNVLILAIGLYFILYGLIGLELFKTIYSITVTQNQFEIVKSYRPDITIDLNDVAYIALKNNELQVHYSDYVRTYNIAWLTGDDYFDLKEKLYEISVDKSMNERKNFN